MTEIAAEVGFEEGSAGLLDIPVVPLRDVGRWAIFVLAVVFVLLYLVGVEEGATSVFAGRYVHEFLHDGRHLLAFPCH